MEPYTQDEKLDLETSVAITGKVHKLLRDEKRKTKTSIAKLVCNAVIEKYGKAIN